MHLHIADAEAGTVEVEDHVVMLGEQRHGNSTVGDLLGDHEGGQAHTEGVVVVTGVPDGDTVAHPGFLGTNGEGTGRNVLDGAAAGGTGVLDQGDGVELNVTGPQLTVLFGSGGIVFVFAFTFHGVVESPVLGLSLTTLHDEALGLLVGVDVFLHVLSGEVHVFFGHTQFGADAVEAELHISLGEAQGEVDSGGFVAESPLVHAPEVGILQAQAGGVDDLGDQRKLFGGADGAADTAGIVGSGFLPGVDVFQSLSAVELLIGVEDIDLEAGTLKGLQIVDIDLGCFVKDLTVKSGVIPPVGGNLGKCAHGKTSCSIFCCCVKGQQLFFCARESCPVLTLHLFPSNVKRADVFSVIFKRSS